MIKTSFLSNKNTFRSTKKRLFWSIIIGLVSAISSYSYLSFLRLVLRIFDNYYELEATIIQEPERFSQNWHFAIISLVLGNSFFIAWLFRSPNRLNLGLKEHTIISQQIVLSVSFFSWFVKLATIIGLFTGLMNSFDFSVIKPLLVLVAVVLFLESFKGVLKVYRSRAYLAIFINLGVILLLSPVLAAINVFDYRSIDTVLLRQNPTVDVPIAEYSESAKDYRNRFVKMKLENNTLVFFYNEAQYDLDKLTDLFIEQNDYPYFRYNSKIILLADANIPFIDVVDFSNMLDRVGFYSLTYVTKQHKEQRLQKPEIQGILTSVFPIENKNSIRDENRLLPPLPSPFAKSASFYDDKVKIELKIGESIIIDAKLMDEKSLLDYFLNTIDASHYFKYQYDDNTSYQNYLTVLSIHKRAIKILRETSKLVEPIYDDYETILNEVAYKEDQSRLVDLFPTAIKYQYEN